MTAPLTIAPAERPLTVWVLQTGEPLHIDEGTPRPMRAMNLSNALTAAGHRVVLWSSAFYHQEKRHRSREAQRIRVSDRLEVRLIPSPGYARNIGPGRLWDHAVMARNLKQLLRAESSAPDVGFIGYPPIETAAVLSRWFRERGVPSVLDVKDLWPSLFLDPLPGALRPFGRVALAPYYSFAKRTMRDVTGVTAMSESFVQWACEFRGTPRQAADRVVPLTPAPGRCTPDELAEARRWWDAQGITERPGLTRLIFVGSHISGFDLTPVRDAAIAARDRGWPVEFILAGDGPVSADWRALLAGLPAVKFPGWIDLPRIQTLAERSQGAMAPYRNIENFTRNMPNKVVDSLKLGLPLLSSLSGEVDAMIRAHGIGFSYAPDSGRTFTQAVDALIRDPAASQQMGARAKALYDERFSFERVYGGIVRHLEGLAEGAAGVPRGVAGGR